MRKIVLGMLAVCISASVTVAQSKKSDTSAVQESRRVALEEVNEMKRLARMGDVPNAAPTTAVFDQESFGKSVVFLGSLYAGTVIVDDFTGQGPFGPNGCPTNPMFGTFAPDDHCIQKDAGIPIPIPAPSPAPFSVTVYDPVWEVTIPGNTVKNVIYPMLNNTVSTFRNGGVFAGTETYSYGPEITIVSDALNDPLAVVNGNPLNGTFTTGLSGSKSRSSGNPGPTAVVPFASETQSYASIAGRGISRDFWRAVGLPESVINNIYKKPMTIKFGIRFRLGNKPDSAVFFYTFRLLGQ